MSDENQSPAPLKFKVKAHLTVPLLKVVDNTDYAVTFETQIVKADATPARKVYEEYTDPTTGEVSKREKAVQQKEPPSTAQVTDLYTGTRKQLIVGSVMLSELSKKYPDHSYVGKSFAFKVFTIAGKAYKGIELAEVEVEPASTDAAPEAKPEAATAKKK